MVQSLAFSKFPPARRVLNDPFSFQAAALYTQAGDYQKTARFYYKKAEDTYYQVTIPFVVSETAPFEFHIRPIDSQHLDSISTSSVTPVKCHLSDAMRLAIVAIQLLASPLSLARVQGC